MINPSSFDALSDRMDKSHRTQHEQMNTLLREARNLNRFLSSTRQEIHILFAAVALSIVLTFIAVNMWRFPSILKVATTMHNDMNRATKTVVDQINQLPSTITQR